MVEARSVNVKNTTTTTTKNFDIFPPDGGMLRKSRCVQIFLFYKQFLYHSGDLGTRPATPSGGSSSFGSSPPPNCCRSFSSRPQRACKHTGRLGGGRRARGPLIPVQEQQGRNQGRLERESKQRKAKKRWIWARHQEQINLERRKQRRRGRPAQRATRAHARVVRSSARAAARSKELVVPT